MRREGQPHRMTVDEFVEWDDGTDTRYGLDDGIAYAMATPRRDHGTIVTNVVRQMLAAFGPTALSTDHRRRHQDRRCPLLCP